MEQNLLAFKLVNAKPTEMIVIPADNSLSSAPQSCIHVSLTIAYSQHVAFIY